MNGSRVAWGLLGIAAPVAAHAQDRPALPAGLEVQTRAVIEQLTDSLRASGLPVAPIYAKVAEGKLKQATDAQIVMAVRNLARRFGAIRSAVGVMGDAQMTAAATAMSAGVPLESIRGLRDAAGTGPNADADFAVALVTITDLVGQRVSAQAAVASVQTLLARRAPADQYTRLRADVANDIGAGRAPDQAIRGRVGPP